MKVAARPLTAQRSKTYLANVSFAMLLPMSTTVRVTVQGLAELDDRVCHLLENRPFGSILRPSAGRQVNPARNTFQVCLNIRCRRIGNLRRMAGAAPECIARPCGFESGRIGPSVLDKSHFPVLVHDTVALEDKPALAPMVRVTFWEL